MMSSGCSEGNQAVASRARRAARTSPAEVHVTYDTPLIDVSSEGSLAAAAIATGALQVVAPGTRDVPYSVPPETKAATTRPLSATPTTGCDEAVSMPVSMRSGGCQAPPAMRTAKMWSTPLSRLT